MQPLGRWLRYVYVLSSLLMCDAEILSQPKAFSPPGVSSGSPLERSTSENLKPLTATAVLDRLSSILASEHVPSQDRGK